MKLGKGKLKGLDVESYEPTYEGLKRRIPYQIAPVPESYEPTYEGLKLRILQLSLDPKQSYEPTYEGLKQFLH